MQRKPNAKNQRPDSRKVRFGIARFFHFPLTITITREILCPLSHEKINHRVDQHQW